MFLASTLLALALPAAEAAPTTKVKSGRIIQNTTTNAGDIVVITSDDGAIADVAATVTSGAGTGTTRLVEADAWLHGGATLAALPSSAAGVTLTVYDSANTVLASFSGTLGTGSTGARMKRADFCGTGDASTCADVAVLAAATYPEADGTYTVAFDLSGAGTLDVAYADLTVTETVPCSTRGCTGDTTTTRTPTELAFDDVGLVWQGAVPVPLDGVSDLTLTATDAAGATLASTRTLVVGAWDDGGVGVSALPTDEDPLTSVALLRGVPAKSTTGYDSVQEVAVTSAGWSLDETLPTYAEITLANGETWNVPANSYQLTTSTPIKFTGDPSKERFYVTANGVKFSAAQAVGGRGICQYGACFSLAQDTGGAWTLSATAYAATPEKLPSKLTVSLSGAYGYAKPGESSYSLAFDAEVAVVFATTVTLAGDPSGLDLTGRVRLRGKQTLLVGKFEGQFGVDEDGDLGLAVIGRDGGTVSRGDILIGGEPIGFELTDIDGDGVVSAPPVIVFRTAQGGYGNGYMPPSASGQTQQTQLL